MARLDYLRLVQLMHLLRACERPWLVGLAALLLVGAGKTPAVQRSLTPQPLPGSGSSLQWSAPQFIQADAKGRIFLLRGDTLEVYPVTRNGELGKPERLPASGSTDDGDLFRATMSTAGGDWVLWRGPGTPVTLFRTGKHETLTDTGWRIEDVGFLRGEPVVNVIPAWAGDLPPGFRWPDPPPFLLEHRARRWSVLHSKPMPVVKDGEHPYKAKMVSRSAVLLGDAEGKLWVAQRYAYRVQRFSSAGRLLLEIVVGGGEPKEVDKPAEAEKKLTAAVERHGMTREGTPRAIAMTAQRVVRAMAARDGILYLLIDGSRPALDRYDAVRGVLERVPIQITRVNGINSMAAGRDGLYFAHYRGDRGRFVVSWDELEAADWRELEDVRVTSAGVDVEDKADEAS